MHITLGQAIWASVKPIIKIYLIIGTGFFLARMNILTAEATRTISDIVLTILLPCLSFNKIVANIEDNDIKNVGIICLSSVLIFATGLFFAWVIRKVMPVPKQWSGGILAGGMFPNISDLPIAYIQTMDQGFIFTPQEGNKGVANVIIFLAMFLICVFNLGGFRLIESDFKYNDEENAVHEDEYSNDDGNNNNNNNSNQDDLSNQHSSLSDLISDEKNGNSIESDDSEKENNVLKQRNSNSASDSLQNSESLESSLDDNEMQVIPQPYRRSEKREATTTNNNNNNGSNRNRLNGNDSNNENTSLHDQVSIQNSFLTTESLPASSICTHSSIDSDEYSTTYDVRDNIDRTRSQPIALTSKGPENRRNRYFHHQRFHRQNRNRNIATGYQSYENTINNLDRAVSLRSIESRDLPPQTMQDIIREYSNVDQFGRPRRSSLVSDASSIHSSFSHQSTLERIKSSNLTKMLTSDATVSKKDIEESGSSLPKWLRKFPLVSLIVFFMKNCLRPCSMAVIIALIIAFIPWVKALFVTTPTTPHIRQAPDEQPALSFLMDYTSYVGAASVPFGLLLLGATLGRLKIGTLYPGFWKSACLLVILRQCVMPIFGVLWCDRLVKAGWLNWTDDKMLLFVIVITWNLPTMTTLIYFTASYTPVDTTNPIQMECVSFFLMLQYPLMVVSLPFLVSYFLKVQMKL